MHRRARGQPVVHQDHDPPPNPRRGPAGAEQRLAAPRLPLLDPRDGGGIGLGDAELADHIPVQEAPAVSRHRADRELGGLRRAQLAREDDVELGPEAARDLSGHDDPTPG